MNLRQQIINEKTEAVARRLAIPSDEAFMRLAHSLVVAQGIHSFDLDDVVDGGQDKQMDVITIAEDDGAADVFILQTKNTESFSSNALVQLHNGLRWVFQRPRKDLDKLGNVALRDKIGQYRSVQQNVGPSNIRIHVSFITNGSTSDLSDEFKQELGLIREEYDNNTFEQFSIEPLGCDELVDLSKAQERQTRRVDAEIKVKYDANNPSLIKYYAQDLTGIVCSVPAIELGRLVNDNADGSIFDLNIRRFLGTRGAVNKDIYSTCTDTNHGHEFWFLNNGITVVCDHFDPVTDPDNPHVKLKNMQIVNGCQTATTLALALREGRLSADVRVLMRIYETRDPELVGRIVLTTNNQNRISSRDLRANEPRQLDMEEGFRICGYLYERKPRQYDDVDVDASKLFSNESVAQWYLAAVLKNPADARGRKYKVWGELHSQIFAGGQVEPYIIASLLGRRVLPWLRSGDRVDSDDEVARIIAKRGSFHVGRIASYIWRSGDNWRLGEATLRKQIRELETPGEHFDATIKESFDTLVGIMKGSEAFSIDIDRALKSSTLDQEIDKHLYRRRSPRRSRRKR